jgi:hypothetical protein
MAKPTDLPVWATDANYPVDGEPEEGTPTKVTPSDPKQALGHRPNEKPKAQNLNWWENLVYQWIEFLGNRIRTYMISPNKGRELDSSAGTWVVGALTPSIPGSTAAGTWVIPVEPVEFSNEDRLRLLDVRLKGDAAVDAVISVVLIDALGVATTLASRSIADVPAAFTPYPFNFAYEETFDGGGGNFLTAENDDGSGFSAFERAVGSFISAGVYVGQQITTTGFVNAANNGTFTVTDVLAGSIRLSVATLVDEVGLGDEEIVAAPVTLTQHSVEVQVEANAANLEVAAVKFEKDDTLVT